MKHFSTKLFYCSILINFTIHFISLIIILVSVKFKEMFRLFTYLIFIKLSLSNYNVNFKEGNRKSYISLAGKFMELVKH